MQKNSSCIKTDQCYLCRVLHFDRQNLMLIHHLMTRLQLMRHIGNISLNIKKKYEMCQEMSFSILVTASSGKPMPELGFFPGRLRWTLFPMSATAIHLVAVDRPLNPPTEGRTSHHRPTNRSSPMPRCQVMIWCAVGALLRNQRQDVKD